MKPQREVAVIGVGMTPFGKFPHRSTREMGEEALWEAMTDAGARPEDIQIAYGGYVGMFMDLPMMAIQVALEQVGITGLPITRVENACGSGSSAYREAWMAIQTGMYDVALAMGIEKLTNPTFDQIRVVRDFGGGDREREGCMGIFPPGIFAMSARRHMQEFGTTREQIAMVSVKNHFHGTMNPKSAYQKEVSLEEVLASRVIADPLRLLECCPNTDGCAAVVLAAKDVLHRFSGDPVWMAGCGQASGTYTGQGEFFMSQLIQDSAREAYEMAGLGPEDIDMAEVHDCFSMAEITHYEDLDFCKRGEGGRLVEDKVTWLGGKLPVNPSGGLLCKGHPLGATGPGQIYEIVKQLRGQGGKKQVEGARVGLHQNGGGFRHCDGGCSIVSILKK